MNGIRIVIVVLPQTVVENLQEKISRGIKDGLRDVGFQIERRAKRNAPVNTGALRRSITIDDSKENVVRVGSNLKYAPFVEFGTKPHMPPWEPIEYWVRRKLRIKDKKELQKVTFIIRKKIAVRGTKGQFYLTRAFNDVKPRIPRVIRLYIQRYLQD